MKATDYRKVESLLSLIGKENSPKRSTILDACGINGYNNPIFASDYVFTSKEQFLKDWERFNNYDSFKSELLVKYGMDNKKVASFFDEQFISCYSMGETECIKIIASFEEIPVELNITVRDNRKEYRGRNKGLNNRSITYGNKTLLVAVKNGRAKYDLIIKDKK